jgi:hypothetical protein
MTTTILKKKSMRRIRSQSAEKLKVTFAPGTKTGEADSSLDKKALKESVILGDLLCGLRGWKVRHNGEGECAVEREMLTGLGISVKDGENKEGEEEEEEVEERVGEMGDVGEISCVLDGLDEVNGRDFVGFDGGDEEFWNSRGRSFGDGIIMDDIDEDDSDDGSDGNQDDDGTREMEEGLDSLDDFDEGIFLGNQTDVNLVVEDIRDSSFGVGENADGVALDTREESLDLDQNEDILPSLF